MNETDPFQDVLTALSLLVVGREPTDTLAHVAALARDGIEDVDYVALTAFRHGKPQTTAATDALVAVIDQAQYDVDAGPCLDAVRFGQAFRIDETFDDTLPWPEFRAAAADAGVHSTLSLPLAVDHETIGALNLYSRRPGTFTDGTQSQVKRFTEPAAVLLLNAYMLWDARALAENLEAALATKAVIEQAKGLLMARQGIDAEAAFDVLRRASQRENVKLREIAQRLVDQAERHAGARRAGVANGRAAGDGVGHDGDGAGRDSDGHDGIGRAGRAGRAGVANGGVAGDGDGHDGASGDGDGRSGSAGKLGRPGQPHQPGRHLRSGRAGRTEHVDLPGEPQEPEGSPGPSTPPAGTTVR